jgi:hypothetical protein
MPQTYPRTPITRIVRTEDPIMKLSMCRADKSVQGYLKRGGGIIQGGRCNKMAMSVDSRRWKFWLGLEKLVIGKAEIMLLQLA